METEIRDALIGRVIDERYRVDARLARGGMATVYEAVDLRLDRVVALKVMHPTLAEDVGFVSRFEREAKSAARLSHPHVVAVYDQGVDGDIVFLAMELVQGRTLRDVLRDHGSLSAGQALVILDPVLEALDAAHRAGFVHRDVKPENVLISNDGRIKVADFGLARAIEPTSSTAPTSGMLIGTVAYLSPEQVERGVADARSDVYGAGILLFEMLTGSVPHSGDTPLAVAYQHVNADVPRPSTIRADIPTPVDDLVARATDRDPDQRYGSAAEFVAAVRAVRMALPPSTALPTARDTAVMPAPATPPPPTPAPAKPRPAKAAPLSAASAPAATPTPARRRKRRGGALLLILLLILAAAGAAGAWYVGSARYVPVPSVLNLTESAAQAKLASADLGITVSARQFSESVKSGLIVSTDPAPGAEARVGSAIAVVISRGPERYKVPSVSDSTVAEATAALSDATLKVAGQKRVYNDTIDPGRVVGTDPESGTSLRRGSEVTLLVSRGPRPVPIPKLIGDSADDATAVLEKLGLTVTTESDYSETVDAGNVISVNPPSGTEVNVGSTVTLVVSEGPPPVTVPDVIDLDRDVAIARLEALGLKVKIEEPLGVTPLNRVIEQLPGAGKTVSKGSTITIKIV